MTITNQATGTRIDEIARGIYRVSTPVRPNPGLPAGFSFNQILIAAEQPRFGADDGIADLRDGNDVARQILAALGNRQHAAPQRARARNARSELAERSLVRRAQIGVDLR